MKKFAVLLAGLMLVGLSISVLAQEEITLYAVGIPDDKIPTIDGDLDDWAWVPELYAVTEWGYAPLLEPEDADDLSIIWRFGWNDTNNKLYGAVRVHDNNILLGESGGTYAWDSIEIFLDPGLTRGRHYFDKDTHIADEGTQWWLTARPDWPTLGIYSGPDPDTYWYPQEPYAKGAARVEGNEIYYEFYITPYLVVNWDGEDLSTPFDLEPGTTIGWRVGVDDADLGLNKNGEDGATTGEYWQSYIDPGSAWGRGPMILTPTEVVAVAPGQWGAIKALFR